MNSERWIVDRKNLTIAHSSLFTFLTIPHLSAKLYAVVLDGELAVP